jgi:hypothetical protein
MIDSTPDASPKDLPVFSDIDILGWLGIGCNQRRVFRKNVPRRVF